MCIRDSLRTAEKKLGFQSFLRLAIQITFSHHEKWNGEGYPRGLKGNKIPLSARIMAVADVYDALRTESYHKKKVSHETCCRVFIKERGIHFDPDIVDAFFRCEKAFAEISEAYYERQDDPQLKSQNSTKMCIRDRPRRLSFFKMCSINHFLRKNSKS